MSDIKKNRAAEKFERTIHGYIEEYDLNIMEATQMYAENHMVDLESLAPLISKSPELKELFYTECRSLNLVK